jgi:hypothetical protein
LYRGGLFGVPCLLATREVKHGHEQFANKFCKYISHEMQIYACQHAKLLILRHFTQSQATKKITISAGI